MALRDSFWSALHWLRRLGRNRYFWGGITALLAVGLGLYFVVDAVIMPSYTRHDVSTRVPSVEDVAFDVAKSRLQRKNLRVERQVGRYNPNVDTGVVVDQTPLPESEVKPGRRVYLTVNAGEIPSVSIPDLTGMSVREAKNRVSSLGLTVGKVREDPIPSPYANTITKQEPAPEDSLKKGGAVDLWYSTGLGDEQVAVPYVLGQRVEDARRTLLSRELRSVVVDTALSSSGGLEETSAQRNQDAAPEEPLFVRRQGRSPTTSVRTGTEIRLYTTDDPDEAAELRAARPDSLGGG
jgi:beta-lactam-binding protein with PASTA domain